MPDKLIAGNEDSATGTGIRVLTARAGPLVKQVVVGKMTSDWEIF